jgi:hypothetical protein
MTTEEDNESDIDGDSEQPKQKRAFFWRTDTDPEFLQDLEYCRTVLRPKFIEQQKHKDEAYQRLLDSIQYQSHEPEFVPEPKPEPRKRKSSKPKKKQAKRKKKP